MRYFVKVLSVVVGMAARGSANPAVTSALRARKGPVTRGRICERSEK